MRSVSMQFEWLTRKEAERYLATCARTNDNYGDRVQASRRCREYSASEIASIADAQHVAEHRRGFMLAHPEYCTGEALTDEGARLFWLEVEGSAPVDRAGARAVVDRRGESYTNEVTSHAA